MAYTCPFCKSTHTEELEYKENGFYKADDGVQRPASDLMPHSTPSTYEYVCLDCGQVSKTIHHQ